MTPRSPEDIRENLAADICAATQVADLRAGGAAIQTIEAFAERLAGADLALKEIESAFDLDAAADMILDARMAEILPEDQRDRIRGRYATGGLVRFRADPAAQAPIDILAGTAVSRSSDGFVFRTLSDTQIEFGEHYSGFVSVVASEIGATGNCFPGDIDALVNPPDGVTSVENTIAITNGLDRETDAAFVGRGRAYLNGGMAKAVPISIIEEARKVNDETYGSVLFVKMSAPDPTYPGRVDLYIDNGLGNCDTSVAVTDEVLCAETAGGERVFYLEYRPVAKPYPIITKRDVGGIAKTPLSYKIIACWGLIELDAPIEEGQVIEVGTYHAYKGLVNLVQTRIDGRPTDPENYPGVTGSGNLVTVKAAGRQGTNWTPIVANVVLKTTVDDVAAELTRLTNLVVSYVNSLDIEQTLQQAELVRLLKSQNTVENVLWITIEGGSSDKVASKGHVVRTNSDNVSIS
jgi:hypothetical protein